MKEKFIKIITSQYVPFIIYGLLMAVFHLTISTNFGDDLIYSKALDDYKLIDFITLRYNTWSSRIIIDIVSILIARVPILWKILDTAAFVWIAVATSIFFNSSKKTSVNWYIILMMLSFPVNTMNTAGWIATTLNYSWCLATGLLALVPVVNSLRNKRTHCCIYIIAIISFLYAANQEQMCAVLIAICVAISIYTLVKNKKIPWFALLTTFLGILCLIFIFTCPGNRYRMDSEINNWFPQFSEFSFFHKIELGYARAMWEFVMKKNLVFLLFSVSLWIAVVSCNENVILHWISAIPLTVSLVFGILLDVFSELLPSLVRLRNSMTETGTGFTFSSPSTWLPLIFVTAVAICVIISLYAVFANTNLTLISIYILLVGLATAWIMGFSPTIWASNNRTFIFMYMSFISVGAILFNRIKNALHNRTLQSPTKLLFTVQIILVADSFLATII